MGVAIYSLKQTQSHMKHNSLSDGKSATLMLQDPLRLRENTHNLQQRVL